MLLDLDPIRFASPECKPGSPHDNDEGVAEGHRLKDCHLFAGSETEVEEASALLIRTFKASDAIQLIMARVGQSHNALFTPR
jgi:hypothetical protein